MHIRQANSFSDLELKMRDAKNKTIHGMTCNFIDIPSEN